jgi:hypothetical protein
MKKFCPQRYIYGKAKEAELLIRIQNNLGETITPTENQFDTKDYTSANYHIELKSRQIYKSDKYDYWYLPVGKIKNRDLTKQLVISYYWSGDDSLWRYDFNPDDIKDFILKKNLAGEATYDIPKRFFTRIES